MYSFASTNLTALFVEQPTTQINSLGNYIRVDMFISPNIMAFHLQGI